MAEPRLLYVKCEKVLYAKIALVSLHALFHSHWYQPSVSKRPGWLLRGRATEESFLSFNALRARPCS